jgi:hypothetical protein
MDGGYYAALYFDTDISLDNTGTTGTFKLLNPFFPPDALTTDSYEVLFSLSLSLSLSLLPPTLTRYYPYPYLILYFQYHSLTLCLSLFLSLFLPLSLNL